MEFQNHLVDIVRFVLYLVTAIGSVIIMARADDNNLVRRTAFVAAGVLVVFNQKLGELLYLLIGSALEALIAAMGVVFVLILFLVVMLLPVLAIAKWVIH